METSREMAVSLLSALKKLNKVLELEGKKVNLNNMAVGLLSEDGLLRKLAFVYLDEKNYWCVFLNGRVEKYSSLSIGDVLISLFFLSSLEKEKRLSDGEAQYNLFRKGKDVFFEKIEYGDYQRQKTALLGC